MLKNVCEFFHPDFLETSWENCIFSDGWEGWERMEGKEGNEKNQGVKKAERKRKYRVQSKFPKLKNVGQNKTICKSSLFGWSKPIRKLYVWKIPVKKPRDSVPLSPVLGMLLPKCFTWARQCLKCWGISLSPPNYQWWLITLLTEISSTASWSWVINSPSPHHTKTRGFLNEENPTFCLQIFCYIFSMARIRQFLQSCILCIKIICQN